MIRRSLVIGFDELSDGLGGVVCRDLVISDTDDRSQIRRGTPVDQALWDRLKEFPGAHLDVVLPESGDLEQGVASRQLGEALAGPGIVLDGPHQGQLNLRAEFPGLLRVDGARVTVANRRGDALIGTSLDGRLVQPGDTIAIVKAAGLFVPARRVDQLAQLATSGPLFWVSPFTVQRGALLVGPRIRPASFGAATTNLRKVLQEFDAELTIAQFVSDDPNDIAGTIDYCARSGVEVILVAGSVVLDPQDPFMRAVELLGGEVVCRGAPIDPGTMFWVGYAGGAAILGLASCELYGRLSVLDLVLPYALAHEQITAELVADFGYGGLLEQTFAARRARSSPTEATTEE